MQFSPSRPPPNAHPEIPHNPPCPPAVSPFHAVPAKSPLARRAAVHAAHPAPRLKRGHVSGHPKNPRPACTAVAPAITCGCSGSRRASARQLRQDPEGSNGTWCLTSLRQTRSTLRGGSSPNGVVPRDFFCPAPPLNRRGHFSESPRAQNSHGIESAERPPKPPPAR